MDEAKGPQKKVTPKPYDQDEHPNEMKQKKKEDWNYLKTTLHG